MRIILAQGPGKEWPEELIKRVEQAPTHVRLFRADVIAILDTLAAITEGEK